MVAPSVQKSSTDGRHVVKIGVFIPTDCQLLDAASVDIMGTMSHEWSVQIRFGGKSHYQMTLMI